MSIRNSSTRDKFKMNRVNESTIPRIIVDRCLNVWTNIFTHWPSFKKFESLLFSSKYSPTNIVRLETLNRKRRNIFFSRQIHSFFNLDADSSTLIVGVGPIFPLLNAFSALEIKYLLY